MTTSYATYLYYTGTYLGSAIASADFARLALRASAVIDQITYNRAAAVITANTPAASVTAIQMATCAIAEEIQTEELAGNIDGIQSESAGSRSVSYNKNARAMQSNESKQKAAGYLYLADTGLMFPGFKSGEYGGQVVSE